MSCCDEVLSLIVACEGTLEREEFMGLLHSAQCHVAVKLEFAHLLVRNLC